MRPRKRSVKRARSFAPRRPWRRDPCPPRLGLEADASGLSSLSFNLADARTLQCTFQESRDSATWLDDENDRTG